MHEAILRVLLPVPPVKGLSSALELRAWAVGVEEERAGTPGWIRTSDLLLRRQALYPD
jgi:hypothetical protein